jgi:hypothetical protein
MDQLENKLSLGHPLFEDVPYAAFIFLALHAFTKTVSTPIVKIVFSKYYFHFLRRKQYSHQTIPIANGFEHGSIML